MNFLMPGKLELASSRSRTPSPCSSLCRRDMIVGEITPSQKYVRKRLDSLLMSRRICETSWRSEQRRKQGRSGLLGSHMSDPVSKQPVGMHTTFSYPRQRLFASASELRLPRKRRLVSTPRRELSESERRLRRSGSRRRGQPEDKLPVKSWKRKKGGRRRKLLRSSKWSSVCLQSPKQMKRTSQSRLEQLSRRNRLTRLTRCRSTGETLLQEKKGRSQMQSRQSPTLSIQREQTDLLDPLWTRRLPRRMS